MLWDDQQVAAEHFICRRPARAGALRSFVTVGFFGVSVRRVSGGFLCLPPALPLCTHLLPFDFFQNTFLFPPELTKIEKGSKERESRAQLRCSGNAGALLGPSTPKAGPSPCAQVTAARRRDPRGMEAGAPDAVDGQQHLPCTGPLSPTSRGPACFGGAPIQGHIKNQPQPEQCFRDILSLSLKTRDLVSHAMISSQSLLSL